MYIIGTLYTVHPHNVHALYTVHPMICTTIMYTLCILCTSPIYILCTIDPIIYTLYTVHPNYIHPIIYTPYSTVHPIICTPYYTLTHPNNQAQGGGAGSREAELVAEWVGLSIVYLIIPPTPSAIGSEKYRRAVAGPVPAQMRIGQTWRVPGTGSDIAVPWRWDVSPECTQG